MAEKKVGMIVILSSPSGAGKTTLVKKISSRNKFKISVSHTTRKPRSNEKNYYGSLRQTVIDNLKKGENIIFDIDWQGTKQIKSRKLKYKIITIFILPPSKKELFNRLLKRDQKDKKIADDRMKQFKTDILHWKEYDFAVINDNIELCYEQILNYIKKQKKSTKKITYNKNIIKKHIENLID